MEHLVGLGDEAIDGVGCFLRGGVGALGRQRSVAGLLRIGVVDRVAQFLAAEDDDEAMFAHRLDEHLDAGYANRLQPFAHLDAALRRRPAGAAVADETLGVERAEVAACGHVARADLEVNAQRLQDAATDAVLQRVVAEQAEMARPAARRDARQHRHTQAAHAVAGAGVEVRRPRRLQLGLAARLQGQSAQAVGHHQDDFRGVVFAQLAHQFVHVHVLEFTDPNFGSIVSTSGFLPLSLSSSVRAAALAVRFESPSSRESRWRSIRSGRARSAVSARGAFHEHGTAR